MTAHRAFTSASRLRSDRPSRSSSVNDQGVAGAQVVQGLLETG